MEKSRTETNATIQLESLATISCLSCRNQKKKCDRKLPNCSLCTRRGRCCDYAPKRSPKIRRDATRPYPEVHATYTPNNLLHTFHSILPDIACWDLPFIPLDKMYATLEYIEKQEKNIIHLSKPEDDMLVVMYALLSYYFRSWNNTSMASIYFEKARQIAASNFDSILSNPIMIVAYTMLAYYCKCEGNAEKAYFYLSCVANYINFNKVDELDEEWILDPNHQPRDFAILKFVRHFYYMVVTVMNTDADASAYVNGSLSKVYLLQQYYREQSQKQDIKSEVGAVLSNSPIVTIDDIKLIRKSLHDPLAPSLVQSQQISSKMYQLIGHLNKLIPKSELDRKPSYLHVRIGLSQGNELDVPLTHEFKSSVVTFYANQYERTISHLQSIVQARTIYRFGDHPFTMQQQQMITNRTDEFLSDLALELLLDTTPISSSEIDVNEETSIFN